MPLDHILKCLKIIIIKINLPLRKPRFNSFFKGVNYVYFLTGCYKNEGNLRISKHVEYFVEHMLFAPFYVIVNVLENEDYAKISLLLKILLHLVNHLNVIAFLTTFEIERLKKLGKHFLLRVVKN
jgi:hypothetical protein